MLFYQNVENLIQYFQASVYVFEANTSKDTNNLSKWKLPKNAYPKCLRSHTQKPRYFNNFCSRDFMKIFVISVRLHYDWHSKCCTSGSICTSCPVTEFTYMGKTDALHPFTATENTQGTRSNYRVSRN